jgi:hypothetical protein
MVQKPTRKEVIIFIFGLALIAFGLLYFTVLVSAHRGNFHQRIHECKWGHECEASPSATMTPEEPTVTPEEIIDPSPTQALNESSSGDGRSDGRSSCPECTQTPLYDLQGEVLSSVSGWK